MSAMAAFEDIICKKRFCFILYSKFRQKLSEGEEQSKGASACRISTPDKGKPISDKGVGVGCLFPVFVTFFALKK